MGTLANQILTIEDKGGDITTLRDNAFDYEKQTEFLLQIQAVDNVGNRATAQLTINITDINDENPRLSVVKDNLRKPHFV